MLLVIQLAHQTVTVGVALIQTVMVGQTPQQDGVLKKGLMLSSMIQLNGRTMMVMDLVTILLVSKVMNVHFLLELKMAFRESVVQQQPVPMVTL